MSDSNAPSSRPTVLSEELAHRVLARAIELDVIAQSGTTVERLREIARDLGIADSSLDAALADVQRSEPAPPPGLFRRWFDRWRGTDRKQSLGDAIVANAAAFATFWVALGFVSTATRGLELGWEFDHALTLGVNVAALWLARHLGARPVSFVLATTATAQLAEYVIHLMYGISSAQGAATHFAVLLASAIGVGATALARGPRASAEPVVTPVAEHSENAESSGWSLLRVEDSYGRSAMRWRLGRSIRAW